MIDLAKETLLTEAQAATLIPAPRPGQKTHKTRVRRAMDHGRITATGETIYLEYTIFGTQRFTSAEAINRYADALTAAHMAARRADAAHPAPTVAKDETPGAPAHQAETVIGRISEGKRRAVTAAGAGRAAQRLRDAQASAGT